MFLGLRKGVRKPTVREREKRISCDEQSEDKSCRLKVEIGIYVRAS